MHVRFDDPELERERGPEIEAVLQRIDWASGPDEIVVLRRLTEGRGGSDVLEVQVAWQNLRSRRIVKVGPPNEVGAEHAAYRRMQPSARFAPIQAATPGALDALQARRGEREAIVYDHVSRFVGEPEVPPRTLEQAARQAIARGGEALDDVIAALEALFTGAKSDLWGRSVAPTTETSWTSALNHRLGPDIVVEIDRFDRRSRRLTLGKPTPEELDRAARYPMDLLNASTTLSSTRIQPGGMIYLVRLRANWRGDRLLASAKTNDALVHTELVCAGGQQIAIIASGLRDHDEFKVYGLVRSTRARAHQELFRAAGLHTDGEILSADGVRVPDPFRALQTALTERLPGRVVARAHGDFNPRNILLVGRTPCVIDYGEMHDGQPIFLDFARLEGCLIRDVLPGWDLARHVRVQRMLAVASRFGDEMADRLARNSGRDRSAFQLLWTIRSAARSMYPGAASQPWWREYLIQLFLFGHLSLKWAEPTRDALLATAAMTGVAGELIEPSNPYHLWDDREVGRVIPEILDVLRQRPADALHPLAEVVDDFDSRGRSADRPAMGLSHLQGAIESARIAYVRHAFAAAALGTLTRLREDHDVYISLAAYIELKGRRDESDASTSGDALDLLTERDEVLLVGDAGGGKSTVARELEYRLAKAVHGADGQLSPRIPLLVRAPTVAKVLHDAGGMKPSAVAVLMNAAGEDWPADVLNIGAVHLTVDALNEVDEDSKSAVASWLVALRRMYPRMPVIACHRRYGYVPGLLPFPTVTLERVEAKQARRYVFEYLHKQEVPDHEELARKLVHFLLDDPEHQQVRDLAQTPLFLWMITDRYRETGVAPTSRGQLFHDFSRWYLEERHRAERNEPVSWQLPYEKKAELLEAIASTLVERSATEIHQDEITQLAPNALRSNCEALLAEIVRAEMLHRDGAMLRFMHQSFQEYFAASHFLKTANDQAALRNSVLSFRWHDTFTILLGFAGDYPDVVSQICETALEVNTTLTAQCLRAAEQPDPRLIDRFIAEQHVALLDGDAGEFAHARAAGALAEYGRKPAVDILADTISNARAPASSRIASLTRLAGMLGQIRFEEIQDDLRAALIRAARATFEEPADTVLRLCAIDVAVKHHLHGLSTYFVEMVSPSEPWSLARAGYEALTSLGIERTRRQEAAYRDLCRSRLPETERQLCKATRRKERERLQEERIAILRQLATPADLGLLLARRFGVGIEAQVCEIMQRVIEMPGEPPPSARPAWDVLRQPFEGGHLVSRPWWRLLAGDDDLVASAAAHRLLDSRIVIVDMDVFARLLSPDLPAARLSAVAALLRFHVGALVVERAEERGRALVEGIRGPVETEAFAKLVEFIREHDWARGHRLAVVADYIFRHRRRAATRPLYFPWRTVSSTTTSTLGVYDGLLGGDVDDARAAVAHLALAGGHELCRGKQLRGLSLTQAAQEKLSKTIIAGGKAWRGPGALAAAQAHAFDMMPWLLKTASRMDPLVESKEFVDDVFGSVRGCDLAGVLWSIGYLARLLHNRGEDSSIAISMLSTIYASDPSRPVMVGAVTALGYLGDWRAVLTNLRPGEPWLHAAASNVFRHWVPGPLTAPVDDLEGAALWIGQRLFDGTTLDPTVRSTLLRVQEQIERRLGRHVRSG
jgi:Ternary complex associated domain 9